MQERRETVRRQADRELLQRLQGQAQTSTDDRRAAEGKEAQRTRRRTIRHTCKVAIEMLIGYSAGNSDDWSVDAVKVGGRILDLSPDGASLFTKQPLETGQELRLAIELRDASKISTNAVVRWVKAIPEKGGYASGVQFGEVTRKDRKRITKFLDELDATAGL